MIATSIAALARLPDLKICLSVYVSASQLCERSGLDLVDMLLDTCAETGLEPSRVWVELTESTVLESDAGVEMLHRLHRAGVRLALDDFGTGYASLSQLERIPFDFVKIDRSFIAPLGSGDSTALRRLAAIVSVVHSFGMTAVAEGIETDAQLVEASSAGCDLLQGFLLGRPMPLPRYAAPGVSSVPGALTATSHSSLGGASAST